MGRPTVVVGNADHSDAIAAVDEFDTVEFEPDDDAPPGSMLAGLRAAAELQRQTRHLELPIGGNFGDRLVVRYRVLAQHEWDQYSVLLTPDVVSGSDALPPMGVLNVRMMAAACETLLWEGEDLGVGFDGKLAELVGYPLPDGTSYDDLTPVEVVTALFASPMAITAHAGQLVRWMQDPTGSDKPGEA